MKKTNKLAAEKSPYLLQHQYNPVDWYPWSVAAFEKAKNENKPIFLSIGYSTCHWCHVMEKESFENEETAKILNDNFVAIKVDREERPDVDQIYMNVCQMMTSGGGWPLSIFMTPDKLPFFAGTYFPPTDRYGKPAFNHLLQKIDELWKTENAELLKSADEIISALKTTHQNTYSFEEGYIDIAFNQLDEIYDEVYGGFSEAPKFPSPHNLQFLLAYGKIKRNKESWKIVSNTLIQMRLGSIYDQLGYGFHRYSVDKFWMVPHFEKMVYDQALITDAYIDAYLNSKDDFYKNVAEQTLDYVLSKMKSDDGLFYSAEDADSEGVEGKFYLWDYDELANILTGDEMNKASKLFNLNKGGNFESHLPEHKNLNIIYLQNIQDVNSFEGIREKLNDYREKRVRPFLDNKILVDLNSLMISAFAKAGYSFNNDAYLKIAVDSFAKLKLSFTDENNIYHAFKSDEKFINGYIDDYSFYINTCIVLYESTFNIEYLHEAEKRLKKANELFWDNENGGYFTSTMENDLPARLKDVYDGAVPSGNSVMLYNLVRLGKYFRNEKYLSMAETMMNYFAPVISRYPAGYTKFLSSAMILNNSSEIILIPGKDISHYKSYLEFLRTTYIPNKIIIPLKNGLDYLKEYSAIDERTTLYLCKNFMCNLPVNQGEEIDKMLSMLA